MSEQKAFRACESCCLVNKDCSPKEVSWCSMCNAWKCDRCMSSVLASVSAATRRMMKRARKLLS